MCFNKLSINFLQSNNLDLNWVYWFIGIFESSGFFFIDESSGYVEFKILVTIDYLDIIIHIYQKFCFGVIESRFKDNYCYIVNDLDKIDFLIFLIKDRLVLSKSYSKFFSFLVLYNKFYKKKFKLNGSLFLPNLKTLWLLGYSECSGYFTLRYNDKYPKHFVINFFILGQEDLNFLLKCFGGGCIIYDNTFNLKYWCIYKVEVLIYLNDSDISINLKKGDFFLLNSFINYFKKNLFIGKNKIFFYKWLNLYNILIKKNLTDDVINYIKGFL